MSYSENTEFNCWLVVIVFPYDDPLSVQETTITNRGNIFGNYFSLYLSICRLTTVLYIAFSYEKITETFVHKKRLKLFAQANAERCTEWFAFWRLPSNRRSQILDKLEGLVFSGNAKVDLYTFSSHNMISKPIKLTGVLA